MSDLVQKLVGALEETLLFCETFSNRWDGQTGAHPFGMVERARAALSEAKAGGWVCASQAPKHPVCQDGNNHYSEYILAWWPGAIAPTRCRWWFRDDSDACNFVADGSHAVFPTVFQPLPAPPAQRGEG